MKKIKSIFAISMMLIAISLTSCSSDDDSSGGGSEAGEGEVIARVNGSSFQSISQGTVGRITANGGTEFLQITAINLNGEAMTIQVTRPVIEETSYDFDDANSITAVATYTIVDTSTFESTSYAAPYMNSGDVGTITITERTATNIKGTFEFTARNQDDDTDTLNVTDGSFNLAL
ncbi:hypothetical protein BST97_08745 [Nonlabens spongiae]|uniref:Lipocalin-like domain-containing protein n=1 Tax=Nonlabens spongiae TaxID=331648 RepID=A0A1W6MKH5_9FLAO|nr:DUF6252 family protein [Nonlabens spongiae]ARN78077.1 hypothetical protein BST97_08745 [Nonlabens spongiae]